jgi:hypothetical protein
MINGELAPISDLFGGQHRLNTLSQLLAGLRVDAFRVCDSTSRAAVQVTKASYCAGAERAEKDGRSKEATIGPHRN